MKLVSVIAQKVGYFIGVTQFDLISTIQKSFLIGRIQGEHTANQRADKRDFTHLDKALTALNKRF